MSYSNQGLYLQWMNDHTWISNRSYCLCSINANEVEVVVSDQSDPNSDVNVDEVQVVIDDPSEPSSDSDHDDEMKSDNCIRKHVQIKCIVLFNNTNSTST